MCELEVASIGLSVIAIIVSVVFARRQERLGRRVADIEFARRSEEVASRLEADVTALLESEPATNRGGERSSLLLINRGPAVATRVDFDSTSTEEGGPHVMREGMTFPMDLDPGQSFPVLATFSYGGRASLDVHLRWEDGRGPQTKTVTLASR